MLVCTAHGSAWSPLVANTTLATVCNARKVQSFYLGQGASLKILWFTGICLIFWEKWISRQIKVQKILELGYKRFLTICQCDGKTTITYYNSNVHFPYFAWGFYMFKDCSYFFIFQLPGNFFHFFFYRFLFYRIIFIQILKAFFREVKHFVYDEICKNFPVYRLSFDSAYYFFQCSLMKFIDRN